MTTLEQQTGYAMPSDASQYESLPSFYGLSYDTAMPELPNVTADTQDFSAYTFDPQYTQTFAQPHNSKFDRAQPTAQDSPYISDGLSFDQQSGPVSTLSGPSLPSAESSALGSPRSVPPHVQISTSPWGDFTELSSAAGPNIVQGDGFLNEYRDDWSHLDASYQPDLDFTKEKNSGAFVGRFSRPLRSTRSSSSTPLQQFSTFTPSVSSCASSPFLSQSLHAFSAPPSLLLDTKLVNPPGLGPVIQVEAPSALADSPQWRTMSETSSVGTPGSTVSEQFKTPITPASAYPNSFKQKKNRALPLASGTAVGPIRRQASRAARLSSHPFRTSEILNTLCGASLPHYTTQAHAGIADVAFVPAPSPLSHYPSLLVPYEAGPYETQGVNFDEQPSVPNPMGSRAASPALSMHSQKSHQGSRYVRSSHPSPHLHATSYQPYPQPHPALSRNSSVNSAYSYASDFGNVQANQSTGEEFIAGSSGSRESYCQECNRNFRDLKAHRLTHQEERPVKCPITTCSYFLKGFSRKYDCQRHTLTHYKGTMVCDFCPGAGTPVEKSFNRADVFKRHLLSVHNVEQSPHNGRKKASPVEESPTATGKCSTCNMSFGTAQALFEHLDECVYKKVTEEDPTAAFTESNLRSVAEDDEVLQEHLGGRLMTSQPWTAEGADDAENNDDEPGKEGRGGGAGAGSSYRRKVRKGPTVFTFSQGGVPLTGKKGRKRGPKQPYSWGKDPEHMTVRKRSLYVHDGPRRLWKDEMMLSTEDPIQEPLANDPVTGEARWLTALDLCSLRRTEALHNATEEEKGEWLDEDGKPIVLEELLK